MSFKMPSGETAVGRGVDLNPTYMHTNIYIHMIYSSHEQSAHKYGYMH